MCKLKFFNCFLCKRKDRLSNRVKLLISIIVVEAAAFIGSLFTMPAIPIWYATLPKPAFTPPSWLFGPVWTILFLMMAAAVYLVWKKGSRHRGVRVALYVFIAQLILNVSWSIIFFGFHNTGFALFEIIILWMTILMTIAAFRRVSKPAAWLLVPYIAWVTFAVILNAAIWDISNRIKNGALIYIPAHSVVNFTVPLEWYQNK